MKTPSNSSGKIDRISTKKKLNFVQICNFYDDLKKNNKIQMVRREKKTISPKISREAEIQSEARIKDICTFRGHGVILGAPVDP